MIVYSVLWCTYVQVLKGDHMDEWGFRDLKIELFGDFRDIAKPLKNLRRNRYLSLALIMTIKRNVFGI